MKQKILISVCVAALFIAFYTNGTVQAEPANVKDCIQDEDCMKTDETPANETDNKQDETADIGVGTGSLFVNLVKMVFALLLVLGLIYGLVKFLNKRNKLFQQVKTLENMGGISVGPNKSIQLVRIGSKLYVVGVGDNVELLQEVTEEEVKSELLEKDARDARSSSLLSPLFQQKNGRNDQTTSRNEFKRLFSTELEKLKRTRRSMIRQKQKDDQHE